MQNYTVVKSIGMGSYAICYSAIRNRDNLLCVIKKFLIPMDQLESVERARIFDEIDILSQLHHVNIIRLYDHFIEDNQASIVMEFADRGSLRELFNKKKGEFLKESFVLTVFAQLMNAISFIHSKHILHRDIKPANILFLSDDMVVKLADFGISKRLVSNNSLASTLIGTPYYLSPELCRNEPYGKKSDIWAAGCVLYELLCGRRPFHSDNIGHLIMAITTNHVFAPLQSPTIVRLLDSILVTDSALRPSADDILEYPIIQNTMRIWNCYLYRTAMPPAPAATRELSFMFSSPESTTPGTLFDSPIQVSPFHPRQPSTPVEGPSSASFRKMFYQGVGLLGFTHRTQGGRKRIDD